MTRGGTASPGQQASDKIKPVTLQSDHARVHICAPTPEVPNSNLAAPDWCLADFERLNELGYGRFGRVFRCRERRSGHIVAIKVMSRERLHKEGMEPQVRREIAIQYSLRHKNILRLYGFFVDQANVYVVLELASGGELYAQISEHGIGEQQAAQYISQLTQALQFCHKHDIIHRDLKPENLLLGDDGEIRMSDFGWARMKGKDSKDNRRLTLCGTADYLAPEMIAQSGHDETVDVWCLGIFMFELLYGKPPFEMPQVDETIALIRKGVWQFPEEPQRSAEAKDVITRLLQFTPSSRIPLHEVMSHPWLQRHVGDITKVI